MAYYVVAAGGSLYKVNTAGVATTLVLPTDITIDSTRPARMAVLGRNVVVVNAPSRSIWVDPIGTVRPLMLRPPIGPPALSGPTAGTLSGTYVAKYTNVVIDPTNGDLLQESDYSAVSSAVTIASKYLTAGGLQPGLDAATTARRVYRVTTGGTTTFFQWVDLNGNTKTSIADQLSDARLSLLAAPTELGSGPGMLPGTYMTLVASWKNRLWAVDDKNVDELRFSGDGIIYGWPATYGLDIPPLGADQYGITMIAARRDELIIGKRNFLWKVVGDGPDTFEIIKIHEGKGCWAPDSACVIDDVVYFLGPDGVYTIGPDGMNCISDADASNGRHGVRAWFATTGFFNRAQFVNAFGKYNATYHTYELHLAASGSSNIDRWVSYDIATQQWYGPHRTSAFTPTAASTIVDADGVATPVIGNAAGFVIKQNQTGFSDYGTAISMDAISKFHDAQSPDIHHYWGELSLHSKIQASAGALQIAVKTGGLDASVGQTLTANMTLGRQRFARLGTGRLLNLRFTEATDALGCEIYGFEVPFHELGRR